jgi:hypothetical protein
MKRIVFNLTLIALVTASATLAQDCLDYTLYARWLGGTYFTGEADAVVLKGSNAMVAGAHDGLAIFDVTDPANPQLLGALALPGAERDVVVTGNVAYVAAGFEGVHVISLIDLAEPTLLATLDTSFSAFAVAPMGSHLLVADFLGGLLVVDVSLPTAPQVVAQVDAGHRVTDVVVYAGHAYLADGDDGVQIVDVTVPADPVSLGFLSSGAATTLAADGTLLAWGNSTGQLGLADVSNPADPVVLGSTSTYDQVITIALDHGRALVGTEQAMILYDVSDPNHWQFALRHDLEDDVSGCAWQDDVALLVTSDRSCWYCGTLQAIDLAQPAMPPVVGESSELSYGGGAEEMLVHGDNVLVAEHGRGLLVYDVSDPTDPHHVGSFPIVEWTYGLAALGDLVYLADYYVGLHIVDISSPHQPTQVNMITSATRLTQLATGSGYLAGVDANQRIRIFDLAEPTAPVIMATIVLQAEAVTVAGDLLLATTTGDQLVAYDMADPAAPVELDRLTLGEYLLDVKITGDLALIAARADGFHVVDIADPLNLGHLATAWTPGPARRVVAAGDVAYASCAGAGIMVFDLSNPAAPAPLACIGEGASHRQHLLTVGPDWVYSQTVYSSSRFVVAYASCATFSDLPDADLPAAAWLQVAPNPFNPRTAISFFIDHPQTVELCIFDMTGKRIAVLADRTFQAGGHSIDWQGKDMQGRAVASGTYLVRMVTDDRITSEKMMLIR